VQPPEQVSDSTLARPAGPEGDARGPVLCGSIRHGKRIVVDIETDGECARLWQS